jgi:hypothetical protein
MVISSQVLIGRGVQVYSFAGVHLILDQSTQATPANVAHSHTIRRCERCRSLSGNGQRQLRGCRPACIGGRFRQVGTLGRSSAPIPIRVKAELRRPQSMPLGHESQEDSYTSGRNWTREKPTTQLLYGIHEDQWLWFSCASNLAITGI